jgi:AsmA protein
VQLLREQDISGQISIESFLFRGLKFEKLRLPVHLKDGLFRSDPFSGVLGAGQINGAFSTEARQNGAFSSFTVNADKLNMSTITSGLDTGVIIGGTAVAGLHLNALAASSDDIVKNLFGSWNFHIKNGSFRQKSNRSQSTAFDNIGASCAIDAGIVRSNDFSLRGSRISVVGSGEINLPEWTIDYRLTVSSPGLKNIPVAYSGSLDDPERSINALHVVVSALGGLGENVITLMQNIITAPFRLLTPQRR